MSRREQVSVNSHLEHSNFQPAILVMLLYILFFFPLALLCSAGYKRFVFLPLPVHPAWMVFRAQREQERQSRQGRIEGYPLTGFPPFPSRLEGVRASERVGVWSTHHLSHRTQTHTFGKIIHVVHSLILWGLSVAELCVCVCSRQDSQISPMRPRLQQDQCCHILHWHVNYQRDSGAAWALGA